MTTLKQVQVSNGSQIDLLFDGKVGKSQARVEYFNDVIQVSLNDVSVYPAKISSVNGGPLVKIFAYQYAPKLVRCRLTVNGKADDFKDKLQIVANGKVLSFRLAGSLAKTDTISAQAAHPTKAASNEDRNLKETEKAKEENEKLAESSKSERKADKSSEHSAEKSSDQPRQIETAKAEAGQNALLERVLKAAAPSKPIPVAVVEGKEGKDRDRNRENDKKQSAPLAGGKSLPSPMGVIAKLLAVIALFGAMAIAAKKFIHGKELESERGLNARLARSAHAESTRGLGQSSSWLSALGGMAKSAASGLGRKDKMIEVLSNHYLGPKKSIAVVRIMGRTLVLGVTNDSINLISQISDASSGLSGDLNSELIGDDANLDLEALFGKGGAAAPSQAPAPAQPAFRSNGANGANGTYGSPSMSSSRPLPGKESSPSSFSALVQQEVKKPATPGVRNQIRSRLEGLKQL
jgi:flagellar biogenesis protein FliO